MGKVRCLLWLVMLVVYCGCSKPPAGERLLADLFARYAAMDSYRDLCQMRAISQVPGLEDVHNEDDALFTFRQASDFKLQGWDGMTVASKDRVTTTYVPFMGKAVVRPHDPDESWRKAVALHGEKLTAFHPVMGLLLDRPQKTEQWLGIVALGEVSQADYLGQQAWQVAFRFDGKPYGHDGEGEGLLWIDKSEGLLRGVQLDFSQIYASSLGRPVTENSLRFTLDQIVVDESLADDAFVAEVAPGHRRIEDFWAIDENSPDDGTFRFLLGKPTPVVAGPTLNGETLDVGVYAGRFVVLEFWGSWCGTCARIMPRMQDLKSAYPELALVGINMDDAGDEVKVRRFVQRAKITSPQILDPQHRLSAAFRVISTPTSVLIDPQGMVRDIHFGWLEDPVAYYREKFE